MDNPQNSLYLKPSALLSLVDKNVDNPQIPVDRMWITQDLSTSKTYPQNYPQVYPQISPLLSTGLSTSYIVIHSCTAPIYGCPYKVFHSLSKLSTSSVDKSSYLWTKTWRLSTGLVQPVDRLWITSTYFTDICCNVSSLEGRGRSGFCGVSIGFEEGYRLLLTW